ncbi:hypothetical protein MTO96_018288 [Rhipicephalus appendiculatus]
MAAAQGAAAATTGASRAGTKMQRRRSIQEGRLAYVPDKGQEGHCGLLRRPANGDIHRTGRERHRQDPRRRDGSIRNAVRERLLRVPDTMPDGVSTDASHRPVPNHRLWQGERFNPNLYRSGSICLNILESGWTPAQGIESLLVSIQSLLNQDPFYNQPGYIKGQADNYASNYKAFVEHETIRVAVCDTVAACLSGNVYVAAYAEGRGAQEVPRVLQPLRGRQ